MRRDVAFFEGAEPVLVYIAKRLKEALKLEALFTGAGVDYLVEADHYTGGIIFRTERVGAFFHVAPGSADVVRRLMRENGYKTFDEMR